MGYLTLEEILETTLPADDVELPECGGSVQVRAVTGAEWAKAKQLATNPRNNILNEIKFAALLVVAGCVEPALPKASEQQLLRQMPAGIITRLATRIGELSGFEEDEDEDQGEA